jgi:hypothetical protein
MAEAATSGIQQADDGAKLLDSQEKWMYYN